MNLRRTIEDLTEKTKDGTIYLLKGAVYLVGMVLTGAGFLGALGVVGYQVFMWLYWGEWIPLRVSQFFPPPYWTGGWYGVHKLVVWFMNREVALDLFVLAIVGVAMYARSPMSLRTRATDQAGPALLAPAAGLARYTT